jgi:hypothetical protein
MYAAGEGLLEVILTDPRFAHQRTTTGEPTTQFHLRSGEWQILGMDSAWKLRVTDLFGRHGHFGRQQCEWLNRCAADTNLGTILLSHHQPFSRKHAYPQLLTMERHFLGETREARNQYRIEAWFWGHEHRCIVYEKPDGVFGLGYGACVGHGAMPERPGEDLTGPNEWELLEIRHQPDIDDEYWRRCGFVVIDFVPGDDPQVSYVDQYGERSRSDADRLERNWST